MLLSNVYPCVSPFFYLDLSLRVCLSQEGEERNKAVDLTRLAAAGIISEAERDALIGPAHDPLASPAHKRQRMATFGEGGSAEGGGGDGGYGLDLPPDDFLQEEGEEGLRQGKEGSSECVPMSQEGEEDDDFL